MPRPMGIYVHVPFCRSRCAYCDFCSTARWGEGTLDAYVSALLAQIDELVPENPRLFADTLYLGGGTPSVLGGGRLSALLQGVRERFGLPQDSEITVEVNPESGTEELFRALRAAGVNRVSMGLQSSDDGELRRIGRIHTFAQVQRAVELCRAHCTDNISLDLMFGLPDQTMDRWLRSVDDAVSLEPKHLSCYALKLEEGTPLWREDPPRPDDDTQADFYLAMVERLAAQGYAQYEISNFCRPGFFSRHNSKYWDLTEYLGFGPGAHSFYQGKRFYFPDDIRAFLQDPAARRPLAEDAPGTGPEDRLEEAVMLALRTTAGLDLSALSRQYGRDLSRLAEPLRTFVPAGYVRQEGERWSLTPRGFLVSNGIIGEVLEALASEKENAES